MRRLELIPGFSHFPIPSLRKRLRARTKLFQIMGDVVTAKIANKALDGKPHYLLDAMLDAKVTSGDAMAPRSAGLSTCWPRILLLQPKSETSAGLLSTFGSFDQWEALQELTFTTAVIEETHSLHPAVYHLNRRVAVAHVGWLGDFYCKGHLVGHCDRKKYREERSELKILPLFLPLETRASK
ncbi:Aste57867_3991 [Aphanomyces stellatus]|uniref:Aste57867_3991 protein n=1 Tax=Aphanomyces stellatus TaxID=120398 RepID=A0A485KAS2_9STRA|nr:hypothetical protein As57867_003980 [Aphanomyces stellatus]VFT81126.1 Aste57867_3991 [Aphanomyces stellatus]